MHPPPADHLLACLPAEEAGRAYDRACVKYRGRTAILNFALSDYQHILNDPDAYDPTAAAEDSSAAGGAARATGATPAPRPSPLPGRPQWQWPQAGGSSSWGGGLPVVAAGWW